MMRIGTVSQSEGSSGFLFWVLGMQENVEPHANYRADIRNRQRPMLVFVGNADELFFPDRFANVFDSERPDVPVTILPGMTHSDMITKPLGIQTAVQAVRQFDERSKSAGHSILALRFTQTRHFQRLQLF